MSTKSEIEKKKSYFASSALAVKFAKAMEKAGATPEEINGMSENQKFLQSMLDNYRGVLGLFDPHQFFTTRKGLWVSDAFCDRILSVAKKTPKSSLVVGDHFDLPEPMNDTDIQKELGEGHIYDDASEFCSFLAGLIDQQPKGEEGDLLADGKANIFYVRGKDNKVFALFVSWHADGREWRVLAYRLGGLRWYAGGRAFPRNSILGK